MLHCAVKFCGGCNPRHDRGQCDGTVRSALSDAAAAAADHRSAAENGRTGSARRAGAGGSLPRDGEQYDVLLILRGCTGCPYLYEDISATHRIVCASQNEADHAAQRITALCAH